MKRFEILNNIRELNASSQRLRVLSKDESLSFDKGNEIRKEQDRVYKKLEFYKGLLKAIDKEQK